MFKRLVQLIVGGHASARLPWTELRRSDEIATVIVDDISQFPRLFQAFVRFPYLHELLSVRDAGLVLPSAEILSRGQILGAEQLQ